MGLLDVLLNARGSLQPSIDQEMENLYGGGVTSMLPPQGSLPGFAGGMFGGEGQGPTERWDPSQTQQPPESYAANDIVVEGFKPKKRSFLGFLADAYLMSKGGKPLFAERIDRKNVDKALRGYADDRLGAIRRLGQIHSRGPDAAKMYDSYVDDERADATQARILGKDNDSRLKSISGLAGVALSNPANRAAAIQQYNARLRAWGLDNYELPDDVSDAELQGIYMGVLPADKQERVKYQQERIQQLGADTQSKIEDRATDNAQAAINERGRDTRNANNIADRQSRSKSAPSNDVAKRRAGRVFQSKDGSLVEWDDKGTRVKVTGGPDGAKPRFYIVDMNGKIIPDPNAPKE